MYHQVARSTRKLNSISLNGISLCFSIRRLKTATDPNPVANNDRTLPDELARKVVSLKCPSTAKGGVCDVYLVGVTHFSSKSRHLVQAVISSLKPQVVFLELCREREGFITCPQFVRANEFDVAYKEAMKYGGNVVLGDSPNSITGQRLKNEVPYSEWVSGCRLVPEVTMQDDIDDDDVDFGKIAKRIQQTTPAYKEVIIHERDKYMSSGLLKVAREHNSVVAVVGEDHLPGMKMNFEQYIQVNGPGELKRRAEVCQDEAGSIAHVLCSVGLLYSVGLLLAYKCLSP